MELSCCHIVLNVSNIDEARSFYVDSLGLPLLENFPSLFAVKAGDVRISVFPGGRKCSADDDASLRFILRTGDFEKTIGLLESKGVKIEGNPAEAPGFMKFATIKDPDGNEIYLAQYLRDPLAAL